MRIGRWSELDVDRVFPGHEVFRETETFDEPQFFVCMSQLMIPYSDPLSELAILLPLVSVDLEYHDE